MTGTTHVAIAAAATIGLAMTTKGDISPPAVGWIAVIIGSLAPDIDSGGGTICRPGSLFGRLLPRFIVAILDAIGLAVGSIVRKVFGHREAIHWPIWGVIMIMLGLNLGWAWLAWFGWGYLMHIMGDFCTKSGVPMLGPVWSKDIKWSPIITGTWPEFVLAACLWGFILWAGWGYIPAEARYWVNKFAYNLLGSISHLRG